MSKELPQQSVLDVGYTEQDLLNTANVLISKALLLDDSTTVRKFEYLIKDYNTTQLLQLVKAIGNVFYLNNYDGIKVESHMDVWEFLYHQKKSDI